LGTITDPQQRGRDEVFQDYHVRVGESVRDTAPPAGGAIDLVEDQINPASASASCEQAVRTRNTPPP